MPKSTKYLVFVLSMILTGCGVFPEPLVDINKSERELYDQFTCEHGEESPPGVTRRIGCVNDKGQIENYEAYERYRNEREFYLGKKNEVIDKDNSNMQNTANPKNAVAD